MAEGSRSGISTLLITGLLAILGTVAGGVIKGYWDTTLAEKKFQSDLVMKALEADDEGERLASLRFMIETNLISEKVIRDGLNQYMQANPDTVPQFRPSSALPSPGTVVPRTEANAGNIDFDVFICDAAKTQQSSLELAGMLVDGLKATGQIGQIRLKHWSFYQEIPLVELEDKITVVVDQGHPESAEVFRVKKALRNSPQATSLQVVGNKGSPTEWLISIIVCPTK